MNANTSTTPRFVLMAAGKRIGPHISLATQSEKCNAIFAFTDKLCYDKFCLNSKEKLTPYPLVKRFLTDLLESSGDELNLIVLDATEPLQPSIKAVTAERVLQAMNDQAGEVEVTHHMDLDPELGGYQIASFT